MSDLAGYGSILSAGVSLYGDTQQSDAAKEQLALEERIAQPGIKARKYLLSLMGKESPMLATLYKKQTAQLGRTGQRLGRQSGLYWNASGNPGRGRGEQIRSQLATSGEQGQLALSYGGAQLQAEQAPAYALAGQPTTGISQAANNLTSLAGAPYADFNAALGQYMGYRMAQNLFGSNDGTGGGSTVANSVGSGSTGDKKSEY